MATNQELLAQAGQVLDSMGVRKALTPTVITTDSAATGEFMDRTQVERLVDLTVSQSAWLSACSVKLRSQRSGEMPRLVINDVVTEGVDENAGASPTTHPDTSNVAYDARKFQATWYYTIEDVREARASGEPDFEGKVRGAFAKAMGNDLARWFLNGDVLLNTSTRLNRLLRRRDGILKKARATANYATTTRGSAFSQALFSALLYALPEVYRDDPDLRWLYSSSLDLAFTNLLAQLAATGSTLGDRAIVERRRFDPSGILPLIVPQLPTDGGFANLLGTTSDADAVADDGDGTMTVTVNTLFGGYDADHAGRVVRILCEATGDSEDCVVADTGAALVLYTVGSLGQAVISVVPADYTLDLADCTCALLTNPLNLCLVLCDKMRSYRKFEQEAERWRIDVFYEGDAVIFNPDAVSFQDGVISPRYTFGA